MAKEKKYTLEQLKDMDLKSLQKIAKGFGLATAGKRVAELAKAILAAQDGNTAKGKKKVAGKGKAPAKGKKSSDDDDDDEEDDSDDEEDDSDEDEEESDDADDSEEEEEAPAKGKTSGPDLAAIERRLAALEKIVKQSSNTAPPAKGKKAASEEEEEDLDEDSDDEDGDDSELRISLDDLNDADLDELKKIAAQINEHEGDTSIKFKNVTKAGPLREAIRDYLNEHADKIEDDGDDDEDEEEESEGPPAWLKKGVKCKAKYEKKWFNAVVVKVGKKAVTVEYTEDETEADVPFSDVKKA